VAAFICGSVLWLILDQTSAILYGVGLMAFIAVLVFSGVLVLEALLSKTPFLDVVLLFALQRSFVKFIFICVLGYVGAFFSILVKSRFGRS
jgi:hypothetical protein